MKKFLSLLFFQALLWSVNAYAIDKPFSLWCKSYKSIYAEDGKTTTTAVSRNYELYLTDDEAFIIGLESLYRNLIRSKNNDNSKYYFSNIGYKGRSSVDKNGRLVPFSALSIDRINGEAVLTDSVINLTVVHMKCTKEKPKLLF